MFKCSICKKEFKTQQGLNSHIGWHNKPKRKSNNNLDVYREKIRSGEIKGENQYTKAKEEGRLITISAETRKKISDKSKNRIWTEEQRKNHSKSMKEAVKNNPESYSANNVCGRTKIIEYRGFSLNGKWELIVAQWLDKKGIKWTNKLERGIEYYWNGGLHLYFPDFYLPEKNLYIEVKGYERERDHYKWNSLDNLLVIKKKEIEEIKNGTFKSLNNWVQT